MKLVGFLIGVFVLVGVGLVFLLMYLWIVIGEEIFVFLFLVGVWLVLIVFLLIFSMFILSWSKLCLWCSIWLEVIVLIGLVVVVLI